MIPGIESRATQTDAHKLISVVVLEKNTRASTPQPMAVNRFLEEIVKGPPGKSPVHDAFRFVGRKLNTRLLIITVP
jgi:hypothetical protein